MVRWRSIFTIQKASETTREVRLPVSHGVAAKPPATVDRYSGQNHRKISGSVHIFEDAMIDKNAETPIGEMGEILSIPDNPR